MANEAAFDAAGSGWYNAGGNLVIAKSASLAVTSAKVFAFTVGQALVSQTFMCTNGTTTVGQSVYAVRSAPQPGAWSVASAVKLSATSDPTWTGTVTGLPPVTSIEWKCAKRKEANFPKVGDQWQPGANSAFTTPATGPGAVPAEPSDPFPGPVDQRGPRQRPEASLAQRPWDGPGDHGTAQPAAPGGLVPRPRPESPNKCPEVLDAGSITA